jgi:hypothetical protein
MIKEAGTYIAKPIGGKFGQSEKGTAGVAIHFEITGDKNKGERITWVGWLSDAARDRTIETLARLGYDESKPESYSSGIDFGAEYFTTGKDFELVVEMEPGQKDPEKTYAKVRWVNDLGGSKFTGLKPGGVNLGFDLKGAMAQARSKLGIQKETSTEQEPLPF